MKYQKKQFNIKAPQGAFLFMEVNMSKKSAKKATFQDLIAKKLQKESEQFKVKDIYVTSMDATLTFKKPTDDQILDITDEIGDGTNTRKMIAEFKKLIYKTCDLLQDTKLHEELEIKDPLDIVSKLFDLSDIMEIGEQLTDFIGIKGKAEEVKNS